MSAYRIDADGYVDRYGNLHNLPPPGCKRWCHAFVSNFKGDVRLLVAVDGGGSAEMAAKEVRRIARRAAAEYAARATVPG